MTPEEKKVLADRFEARLRAVFRPDDGGDIVKWLVDNVRQIPFSPMPSGFKVDETPWLAEPLRAAANPAIRILWVIAPIQSGKSLMLELLSCFIVARQPADTLYLTDTEPKADDWLQSRLRRLWNNVPAVLKKLKKDETGKKANAVQTEDMNFWCLGQKAKGNLQSKTIRWLVGDETWQWDKGHIEEAKSRVFSFGWLGKCIFVSQGSNRGDETDQNWHTTTKAEWSFACPKCGHRQGFKFEQLKYPDIRDADGDYDYLKIKSLTVYECEGCKHHFPDNRASRVEMNKRGFYAITNPNADPAFVGYHWNGLCCRSWGMMMEIYLRAKVEREQNGDDTPMRIFIQKQLAEMWTDVPDGFISLTAIGEYKQGEIWEEESIIDPTTKRAHSDKTRKGIAARFMTVDCQQTGFYCLIRQWKVGGESRLLRWKFVTTWEDVKAMAELNGVAPALVFVDSGDQMNDVIHNCGQNKWTALRGDRRNEFAWSVETKQGRRQVAKVYSAARVMNVGTGPVRVHHYSNLALKDRLAGLRRIGKLTAPADCGQDYLDQMESEIRKKNLDGKPEWKRIGKRANHLFDCEVMQLVPAMAFGLLENPNRDLKKEEADKINAQDGPQEQEKPAP